MRNLIRIALLAGVALAAPANALNVLVSNDDGFETANIRALYQRLVAAGHSVIVSAPTQNQSGQGGRVDFLRPIGPLAVATRWGTVPAGSPGVGVDPANPDIHYVDGSPVASLLYGLDVLAPAKWGRGPDVVISGPNEGNNLGAVNISSGTVANALYAINRGVPVIAVSAGETTGRPYTGLVPGDVSYQNADVVLRILTRITDVPPGAEWPVMPRGIGLNVNIPARTPACNPTGYRVTDMGTATTALPVFYADIATSPIAQGAGLGGVHLPGVSVVVPGIPLPAGVSVPADPNPKSEANVVASCKISVTIMRGVPEFRTIYYQSTEFRLSRLPK